MTKVSASTTANVNVDYDVEVTQASSTTSVQKNTAVQDTPSPTSQEVNTAAPTLSAPATTDYDGASSFSANYLELIVLMCQLNRDSYEANQEIAQMQIQTRVADLKEAASKRMTAAIVGLCVGIVSAGLSLGGAAVSGVNIYKNTTSLTKMKGSMTGASEPGAEIEMTTNKTNQDKLQNSENNLVQNKASAIDNQERSELATIENRTAINQLTTMLTRTLSEGTSSIGNSSASMINAKADGIQAEAEEVEASRQLSVSNRQMFQDLMGKFNQILQSFLEAEIKAASAAAQA